jgi:hypothetical protein
MLPHELDVKINKTLKLIQYYKNFFIANDGDINQIFGKYINNISTFQNLLTEALNVVQHNKSERLICRKTEADWLMNNSIDVYDEISKHGGFYNKSTLKYVLNDHFIIEHQTEFKNKIRNTNLKIVDVKNGFIKFSFLHSKTIHPITFHVTTKFFMNNIGCYCLTSDEFKYDVNSINDVKIEPSVNNFYSLLNVMKTAMNTANLDIEIHNDVNLFYLKKLSQMQFSHSRTRTIKSEVGYKKITYQSFIEFCNDILFTSNEEMISKFNNLHHSYTIRNEWINKKQKDTEISIIKSAPTFTKQKEFI